MIQAAVLHVIVFKQVFRHITIGTRGVGVESAPVLQPDHRMFDPIIECVDVAHVAAHAPTPVNRNRQAKQSAGTIRNLCKGFLSDKLTTQGRWPNMLN
jgi:hypothetical protein